MLPLISVTLHLRRWSGRRPYRNTIPASPVCCGFAADPAGVGTTAAPAHSLRHATCVYGYARSVAESWQHQISYAPISVNKLCQKFQNYIQHYSLIPTGVTYSTPENHWLARRGSAMRPLPQSPNPCSTNARITEATTPHSMAHCLESFSCYYYYFILFFCPPAQSLWA